VDILSHGKKLRFNIKNVAGPHDGHLSKR